MFCGPRFYNAVALSCPGSSYPKQKTCFQQESSSEEECPLIDVSASKDGLELLFHAMEGEAPLHVTLQQAVGMINQAKYCMADTLIPLLPSYFAPITKELQPREVRTFVLCYPQTLARILVAHSVRLKNAQSWPSFEF